MIFVDWIGANENVEIVAEDISKEYYSFAVKSSNSSEYTNINYVKGYKKLTYKNLYDKIDVEYLIHPEGGVKYNIILHPNADLSQVKLRYSSNHTATTKTEFINTLLNGKGQLEINTSLGTILENEPVSFYSKSKEAIQSSYNFQNNILTFDLGNYDASKKVVIDPWIVSPTYNTSTAVWEVESDAAGNAYAIGGETPMVLKKYNSTGTLVWNYTTPWDTASVWLGTLATDASGTSYVTAGTSPAMQKVNTAGGLVWTSTGSGGLFSSETEWWSITFNCDMTKLLVGGTKFAPFPTITDVWAAIFDIDISNGNVLGEATFAYTNIFGMSFPPPMPEEVRSITSSKNGKYIYLTHNNVGAISQNLNLCGPGESLYEVDNQFPLGYKCENYLPATQNGGGLKALIANEDYFYTHTGNQIHRWDISTGTLINSVPLTGGASTNTPLIGGLVVENSGLAVDNCGNIYAGSGDRVVKFSPDLTVLSTAATTFTVYDVSVNSNGEVIAVGAQQDNQSTNRNGRIQSLAMSACAQFAQICCDATVCIPNDICQNDAPITLVTATSGGTWSGNGVNASGVFNPATAGPGQHLITYTLPCGSETITIVVSPCQSLEVCEESNGTITVSNGVGPYDWDQWVAASSTPITNQAQCEACGYTWFAGLPPFLPSQCQDGMFQQVTTCNSAAGWEFYTTGTTITPPVGATQMQVTDFAGTTLIVDLSTLPACVTNPCPTITVAMSNVNNVTCLGLTNGSATATATGGAGPYTYTWTPGNLNGATQTTLGAGTYTINVLDNNNCPGTGTVTITQPTSALTATASSTPTGCGASTGTATASPNGGTPAYTYSWAPSGGTGITASNLSAGTYTVTVTDLNGCTTTATTTVSNTNGPSISVSSSNNVSCFGDTDGSATVTGSGGTGTLTYNWMPGNLSGATQNALDAGTYTVTVTDGSGCTNSTTVTINEPPSISITQGTITPADCGQSNGSASVNVSGGAGGFTYSWLPTGGTSTTANNIPSGTYTFEAEDQNGCIATLNVVVTNIGGPTVTVQSSTDVSCFGLSDGSAAVTVIGGTSPYTYNWSPSGGTGATATNLAAGTYTVAVTDNTSCVGSTTVTIVEPNAIVVTETIVDANCGSSDGSISLAAIGGSTPYTFTWTPNGETTNSINGIAAGSYGVTVTDDNGCSTTESYTVLNVGSIPITVSPVTTTITQGESVQLQATGATTYTWSPTTGLSCSDCPNPVATPNLTTTYTVTGTDAFGCTGTAQTTISVVNLCGDLFVPTVFTPNDQGPAANNILCIQGNCIAELKYSVYNRWGEVVFTTEDPSECWDGTYREKPVQTGVYAYKIYAVLFDGTEINESGNLTILK